MPAAHFQKRFMLPRPSPQFQTRPSKKCASETAVTRRCKLALNEYRQNSAFVLVAILSPQALSFFLVLRQRFFNDFNRGVGGPDVFHLDLLAFQLLVVLEEALQNEQAVRRQFIRLDVAVEFR